jgi:Flp pilus assembly protein TadG
MRPLWNFWQNQRGGTAAEFALVVPIFGALTIGAIQLCVLVFANSRLQYAVDDAARCESVKTTICTSGTTTQNHASATFGLSSLSPVFTASSTPQSCGYQVVGTATYRLNAVLTTLPVSLSATSCFPIQD